MKDYPSTRLLFIDTLQMVRDNVSAKVNAYAQDYKDLSALKKIADNHGICIFVVHHTRKERDGGNIFNDMTGSTGIMGVADTVMILRKDDRFGDNATLCITGRDVEEKKLKMQMHGVKWEITEELSADDLRKERIPDFVFKVVDFLFEHGQFEGTVSDLLAAVGNTELIQQPLSAECREACRRLDRYSDEVELVCREHLETPQDIQGSPTSTPSRVYCTCRSLRQQHRCLQDRNTADGKSGAGHHPPGHALR